MNRILVSCCLALVTLTGAFAEEVKGDLHLMQGPSRQAWSFKAIADLKAATRMVDEQVAVVSCYYACSGPDGGGGVFKWDAVATEPDNGGTVLAANAVRVGRWRRIFTGDIWANWFGVATSGSAARNLAALQKALDMTEKDGRVGGVVRLQKGAYELGGPLRIGGWVRLIGEGAFSTSLYWSSRSGNCVELGPDETGAFKSSHSYTFGSILEEISLDAGDIDRGPSAAVIHTVGAHQPSGLRRVGVRKFRNIGVHVERGNGHPASFLLDEVELQASDVPPKSGGTIGLESSAGGAIVSAQRVFIQGSPKNQLAYGIRMEKDHLALDVGHFEYAKIAISLEQAEKALRTNTIANVTGHRSVPVLIEVSPAANVLYTLISVSNTSIEAVSLDLLRDHAGGIHIGGVHGKAVDKLSRSQGDRGMQ